jgi:hypothetical protein
MFANRAGVLFSWAWLLWEVIPLTVRNARIRESAPSEHGREKVFDRLRLMAFCLRLLAPKA